jgi:hypothetical protein
LSLPACPLVSVVTWKDIHAKAAPHPFSEQVNFSHGEYTRDNASQAVLGVTMEEVRIPGIVEGTRAEVLAVGIVSQRKSVLINEYLPVLDLFEESAMYGMITRDVFQSLLYGCSLEIGEP